MPASLEPVHRLDDRSAVLAHGQPNDRAVALGPLIGHRLKRADRGRNVGRVVKRDLEPLAADPVLELVGRTLGDHLTVVDHRDPVREAIGLIEVLGRQQHGRPLRHELLDHVPQREPAAGIEAGRGLVEEQDRRLGDERRGEVEPAAHPAGVGLDGTARRVDEVEALAAAPRRAPARCVAACRTAGRPSSGSRARSGSRRRLRTGRRGRSARAAWRRRGRRRRPATEADPPSGSSSVVRILTNVVLPAPLGPSSPSTVPRATSRSTSHNARTSPNDFDNPRVLMAAPDSTTPTVRDSRN